MCKLCNIPGPIVPLDERAKYVCRHSFPPISIYFLQKCYFFIADQKEEIGVFPKKVA